MFRPAVAIIRFYPKLYAKKRVIQCEPNSNDVKISSSTCQAKFIPYGLLVAGVVLWTEWYSLDKGGIPVGS